LSRVTAFEPGAGRTWVEFIKNNCIAVAVDAYVPGTDDEAAFLKKATAGTNQAVLVTAGGMPLGRYQFNRFNTLGEGLEKFRRLPEAERKPRIDRPKKVTGTGVPRTPPPGGLVAICYWTYLDRETTGELTRAKRVFADAYAGSGAPMSPAYTDLEMFWLTRGEWQSLVPARPEPGLKFPVPGAIQRRIFRFYAFDFRGRDREEANVRAGQLSLTVEEVTPNRIRLRVGGHAKTGIAYEEYQSSPPTRIGPGGFGGESAKAGSELTFSGFLDYDRKKQAFTRFDLVGVGDAWGEGTNRYRGAGAYGKPRRWPLGMAFELVKADRPVDRIPPFAANQYREYHNDYFGTKKK
jgi:hypothetical protein